MPNPSRRRLLARAARGLASAAAASAAASSLSCGGRGFLGLGAPGPALTGGVASGDVAHDSAVVWAAADKAARMHIEWDTAESFPRPTAVVGPDAVPRTGLTAQHTLTGLPADTRIFFRVRFEGLADEVLSDPVEGSFRTAPLPAGAAPHAPTRDVRFAWSGDTAGQGWGIDPARGGMPAYAALERLRPDFFIHSGDNIYADIPIPEAIPLPSGEIWHNITTAAKSRPAQSLDDFRGNYAYNLLDVNVRRFNAAVPLVVQWDDHEVRNNWYPGQVLDDPKYAERDADILAARARQAFLEYLPLRRDPDDPHRIFRSYPYGPLLEVFLLDERSYRGTNSPNRQPTLDRASRFLGPPQLEWLKRSLAASKATWKVIASDMPIACICRDGKTDFEAWANADNGPPLGRELEMASLLSFLKASKVRNVLFITADVHYAATIHYHPDRAKAFKDFDPFYEFVSGPLHAGGFGPNALDLTFGPEYRWKRPPEKSGDGPGHGYANFGSIHIDAKTRVLRVTHHGIDGKELARTEIEPAKDEG